ncbi:MAG: restriction endonuclease subunit S [Microcystis panniformis WG22]|nr:restriction endonuclease subunit S [Microcystis panniformis WG22]
MKELKFYLLGELGEITSSKRIFQSEYVDDGIPFYRTKEIKELANKEPISNELFISRERYEEIKVKFGVPEVGDILITAIGTVGEIYIVENEKEFYFKDGNILWLKGFKDVDPFFLRYLLSSLINELQNLSSGSAYKALPITKLKEYKIPLPPLEEQRRIAAILDKADGVRRKRKEAIRLTEELLKSTFLEMFGDPVTNPKGWEIVKLGSLVVGQPNNGIFKKNHEYGGDTPVVWVKELFSGYTIDCSESRTLTPTDEEVKKFGLTKGDILFCRSSLNRDGIGFNNVFDGMDFSALFECHIIRVRLNQKKVNSIFLNYLLHFPGLRKQIIAKANTVTMSTIGQSEIKKIEFYLPPKELQDKFEIFLRKIATNRTKLENKEYENLFNSLLQRAFRGEL